MEENIGFKKEIFASEQKSNYDLEALKSLCQQVLDNHNELKSKLKASTDIENDCQFVLPKLLGQVMKLSNGKANSTQAKEAISELLDIELPKDAWTMQKKEKLAKDSNHEISKNPRRRPPTVVSKLPGKCPNILVLHGWGQNGTMLEKTMKKLIKKFCIGDTARLHFMSGPHKIPCKSKIDIDGSLVEIENHSPEKDERAWFLYEPLDHAKVPEDFLDQTRPYIGVDYTVECIKNEWIKYGPFDGLLGFSQGAVMAHIITSLKKNCDSEKYPWLQSLQFGIFVAGFPSRMEPPLLGKNTPGVKMDIPSLHISGKTDEHVPTKYQEELKNCFSDPEWHFHGKGHIIPQTAPDIEAMSKFLMRRRILNEF